MGLIELILDNILFFILIIDFILILVLLFWENSDPKSMLLWIVILILLPILGFFLYLFFGQTFYSERTFKKKAKNDSDQEEEVGRKVNNEMDKMMAEEVSANPQNNEKIRMVSTLRNAGSELYTNCNGVEFFSVSEKYFENLLSDLSNAKKTINFEYYIVRNDDISNKLMDILIERVKSGVEVRLMIDAIGNNKGPKKKIKEFISAGGHYSLFHSTLTCLLSPRKNNRNHRKIAVIDCEVAYVGGYNIGDEYLGKGPLGFWRDSAVRIVGPEVLATQFRFLADWRYATKEDLVLDARFYPKNAEDIDMTGKESIQMISGGPDVWSSNPIQIQYLNIINHARDTLYIHTPYLAPDQTLMDALRNSAHSGVDVRIIIPKVGDHPFVYWSNRYYANVLMRSGVKIFEYNRGFVHSKTMVADEYYCTVGSANLDERSVKLNFETNSMVYSEDVGKKMQSAFIEDLEYCSEYTAKTYSERTTMQKMKTSISRMCSGQL